MGEGTVTAGLWNGKTANFLRELEYWFVATMGSRDGGKYKNQKRQKEDPKFGLTASLLIPKTHSCEKNQQTSV